MVSETFPAGSICQGTTQESGLTVYANSTVANCQLYAQTSGVTVAAACVTDNCAGTAGTGTMCPATSAATSCSVGLTGPDAVVTALGTLFSAMAGEDSPMIVSASAPKATTVPTGTACMAVTAQCKSLALPGLAASACPAGQSLTVLLGAPAISAANDEGSCNDMLQSFAIMNFSTFVACGTNNCNAPTAVTYVAASATLGGYTQATFGTKEVGQFQYAMADLLNVANNAVVVTSVANAPGRRHLLAGVTVAFSVTATVGTANTLSTALAAPVSATALQGAGLTAVTSVAVAVAPAAATTTAPTAVVASTLTNTGVAAAPSAAVKPAAFAVAAAAMLATALLA